MRWFISIRYFLSHKRQSLVCIAGVTISVMMFIAMTSLMQGFTDKFIVETVESSGHITIHDEPRETRTKILEQVYPDPNALLALDSEKPRTQVKKIKNPEGLLGVLRRLPRIEAVAPMGICPDPEAPSHATRAPPPRRRPRPGAGRRVRRAPERVHGG